MRIYNSRNYLRLLNIKIICDSMNDLQQYKLFKVTQQDILENQIKYLQQ